MNIRSRAFTLVELLVTVSVIAILLSLTIGILGRAKDAGKQVRCLANLRSLHAAVELYRTDYKLMYPYAESVAELYPSWVHAPYGSLAQSLMITIPAQAPRPVKAPEPMWCAADRLERHPGGISYVYMPWELMAAWPGTNAQRSVSMALERAPDELLFVEQSSSNHGGGAVGHIDVKGSAAMHGITK
ncbi:MAG: type II secretion system protein [Phycisphaerales bacterium]|nr:type II secretion system protein [Phycisphaerales bacterium]